MDQFLQFFILLPLCGFIISLFLPAKNERIIALTTISIATIQFIALILFTGYWIANGLAVLDIKHITFFKTADIEIFIDFYFDRTTAVFAFVGSLIFLLVAIFSRYYLHRDQGFKRYFCTILLFIAGYNLVVFGGNFETLFMGWEILGICSFLLIAYYRDRYLPVKNSLKVISYFRLGDICLILAMWMSHQLWHQNITFFQLNDSVSVQSHLLEHQGYGMFIAIVLLLAAAIKSAQFPFSSWLPRAMEGPTTSSAIFYGSLSVHLGVFLLLRTYPYWESLLTIKILVALIGLTTSILGAWMASVQSTVKTQIAYSSLTQIGIMFIEIAMGWHLLALIHFAGNAFLRTYQLLISPSVMSYLIHNMMYQTPVRVISGRPGLMTKLKNSIYILSVKEWNLDTYAFRFLWQPFKFIGSRAGFLSNRSSVIVLTIIFAIGIYCDLNYTRIPSNIYILLPVLFAAIGLMLIIYSFSERKKIKAAWLFIIGGQLFITLAIALFHEDYGQNHILLYLSGAGLAAGIGYYCLHRILLADSSTDLGRFHGHAYEHPALALVFLICCLGLIGFPFTPTFIGIDLLFSHIHREEIVLIIFVSLSFILSELAILRIYARVFLGPHKKAYHPVAYRSS